MTTFLLSLLIFLLKTLLGFFIVHRIWPERSWQTLVIKLVSGFVLGAGISSALMLFALRAGIPPSTYARSEFGFTVFLLIIAAILTYHSQPLQAKHLPNVLRQKTNISWPETAPLIILLLAFILSSGAFIYYSFQHPHGFSDAWTIWNNLARYIFRSNDAGLIFDTTRYFRIHYDYPAMYSMNIAGAWSVLQSDSTRTPIAFTFLGVFAIPIALWASVSYLKGNLQGTIVATIALMTPHFGLTVGQYSDVFLALHILLTGIFLYSYQIKSEARFLLLAGLMAGFAAWTKNEGLLFLAISGAVSVWLVIRNHRTKHFLAFIAGVTLPLLVVIFFKTTVFHRNDLTSSPEKSLLYLLDMPRYAQIALAYLTYSWRFSDWPISPVLVLSVYAILVRFSAEIKNCLVIFFLLLLQHAGYFLIYLITPHDLDWHIYTSLTRLLLHTYPLALFWLFVALNSPDKGTSETCSSLSTSATPT